MKQKFLVGSRAFFGGIDGFKSANRNMLELVDNPAFKEGKEQNDRVTRVFKYTREPARQMIERAVKSDNPLQAGKFLIPEVARAIGATIEDILPLEALLSKLDSKHQYQAIIFNAYKENGSFTLTDEQRQAAYASYLDARKTAKKTDPAE